MTQITVNTYTHSVTYVADNILKSLKDIIRLSGLDPSGFVGDWSAYRAGLATWLATRHLELVILEIFNPRTDALIVRWDVDVVYGASGDGGFWTDGELLKYHIRKAGVAPSSARYRLVIRHLPGAPDVDGWGSAASRSTAGMSRQSLGSTIEHNGLGAKTAYWRKG